MERAELAAQAKALGIKGWNKLKTDALAGAVKKAQSAANRKGNKSGNTPWRAKFYFVPAEVLDHPDFSKAPNQVQLMLKAAIARGYTDAENSAQGAAIASAAVEAGMSTKIDPAVLFAYYRRRMEALGLVFAGYSVTRQ